MLARLFKRRKPAGAALPALVEAALSGLSATVRPDHDGKARTLLAWPGESGTVAWHHAPAETRRRLIEAFPALDADQIDYAARAVAGIVRRAQEERPAAAGNRSWSASSWAPRDHGSFWEN